MYIQIFIAILKVLFYIIIIIQLMTIGRLSPVVICVYPFSFSTTTFLIGFLCFMVAIKCRMNFYYYYRPRKRPSFRAATFVVCRVTSSI